MNRPVPVHRILVVDDEREVADTQALFLRLFGQSVQQAYDGISALEVAREFRPDIVFMDLVMPVMDGIAVARRIREIEGMARAKIVALTALSQDGFRDLAEAAGFDAYIVKPASATEIISVLVDVAAGRDREAQTD